MPTTSGWLVTVAALGAVGVGRFFGIAELFVIGAGLAASVLWAVVSVTLRRPDLSVTRTIEPERVTAGEPARSELVLRNAGRTRSAALLVTEAVGRTSSARMRIGPLAAGDRVVAAYRIPTSRRGRVPIGPTVVVRHDALGLAATTATVTGVDDVVVAPPTVTVAMPAVGAGTLGRELAATAGRLGPGEFHALRAYVPGDEVRSVDWKASARTDDLVVREHRTPDLRRCVVVLDRSDGPSGSGSTNSDQGDDAFELAIVIAASLVRSAATARLSTRFVTGGGIDLRGPDVADRTLDVLATAELGPRLDDTYRDPTDELGLLVLVTSGPGPSAWSGSAADPTLTTVRIFTGPHPGVDGSPADRSVTVDAPTLAAFTDAWARLVSDAAPGPRGRSDQR